MQFAEQFPDSYCVAADYTIELDALWPEGSTDTTDFKGYRSDRAPWQPTVVRRDRDRLRSLDRAQGGLFYINTLSELWAERRDFNGSGVENEMVAYHF